MDLMCADLLVDILRRLPPRSIAASRCVCKAWHAIVDDHRLLRANLLPLSLDGITYWTMDTQAPRLFARRSTVCDITRRLGYLDGSAGKKRWSWPMYNSCNGLLLLHGHVVNPATWQWALLGPVPCTCSLSPYGVCGCHRGNRYIAYDPTVSPHYKVLLIPDTSDHVPVSTAEWPPASYIIRVFSSKSMCWKERPFVREGDAAGTVADMTTAPLYLFHSAYWQGALYVPRIYGFILRYFYLLFHPPFIISFGFSYK